MLPKEIVTILLGFVLVMTISPESYASNCGSEPSLSTVVGETRESIQEFRSIIYKAGRQVDFVGTVSTVFNDHKTADQQVARIFMLYYGCIFIDEMRIEFEYRNILVSDLRISLQQVDQTKPIEKTSVPSMDESLTPRRPVRDLTPIRVNPSRGENSIPSKLPPHFVSFNNDYRISQKSNSLGECRDDHLSPHFVNDAGVDPSLAAIPYSQSADKYLRQAPIVLLEANSYWVVVAAARTEADGRTLLRSLKDRFPTYDFALYGPTGTRTLSGIMMATWVSRREAMEILSAAQKVNSNAFVWKAGNGPGKQLFPPLPDSLVLPIPEAPTISAEEIPPQENDFWTWKGLGAEWRAMLKDSGIVIGANYFSESFDNPWGGVRRGPIYQGTIIAKLDLDLEKMLGWPAAELFVNAAQVHGRGLTSNNLHNLFSVSNLEANRATRLFDIWLDQTFFDKRISVRFGQMAADDEFIVSQYSATLMNFTFGWPGLTKTDLPGGGPTYPLPTPGIRIKYAPSDSLSFASAVFNGNPAGAITNRNRNPDPQLRDPSGINFNVNNDIFTIFEATYSPNIDALPLSSAYKLGAWYHSGKFLDQHVDSAGLSLASPASNGIPRIHVNDFGIYGSIDQLIWRKPETEDAGIGGFLRVLAAPADRNLVSFYVDGGLNFAGLLPYRSDDGAAIGLAYGAISPDRQALDRDLSSKAGNFVPVQDYEAVLELTYQAAISSWWTLQPDLQYVMHPGGNIRNPVTGRGVVGNALIFGLRSKIKF